MALLVRPLRAGEDQTFLDVQRESVRGLAVDAYADAVIQAWAPHQLPPAKLQRFLANADNETRVIAEVDGVPVGIGAVVLEDCELLACYVSPAAARGGVGRAIVAELENIARHHGCAHLELEASVNAEPFYAALGYSVVGRGHLTIAPGVEMAAITMHKSLV